jgi:[amino group carrier protein]-lysine/ornithine hydrolase
MRTAYPSDTQADELLTGLVERYSPSTDEREAVAYLVAWANAAGLRAEVDAAGNAVLTRGEGDRVIVLLGHIDTVPGFIDVRREGTHLFGRGAVDAKGPLAAFAVAAARTTPREGTRIVVVGAVEEECASSKGARFLLDRLAPHAVVIGEPSGWNCLTVGYKGRLLVDYTLQCEIGHTAGPDGSACDEAFAFWQQVQSLADPAPRIFDQLTPTLRAMHSHSDGFTETAELTIGFRLPLGLDIDALIANLTVLAGDAHLSFRGREPAFRAAKNTPLARAFIGAIDAESGDAPTFRAQFKVKSGTSDMNVVGPVWACPILAYGPGDSQLDHTPHEHIDLDEYHRAIAVLTRVLESI